MTELVRIHSTVISYVTEENERVVNALRHIIPTDLHSKAIGRQATQSQFGDPLMIYSFESENNKEIDSILHHIGESMDSTNRDYLTRNIAKKVDLNERSIYLRFDKFKAYLGSTMIAEGSEVIRVEISYAAYTKKQNSLEAIIELLRGYNIVN